VNVVVSEHSSNPKKASLMHRLGMAVLWLIASGDGLLLAFMLQSDAFVSLRSDEFHAYHNGKPQLPLEVEVSILIYTPVPVTLLALVNGFAILCALSTLRVGPKSPS